MFDGQRSKVEGPKSKVEGLSTYVIEAEGRICLNSGLRLNPNLNYEQSALRTTNAVTGNSFPA